MKTTHLKDSTEISCLLSSEAFVLDDHVEGYFNHGRSIKDGSVVFDVGANIGIFGIRTLQKGSNIRFFAFELVPMMVYLISMTLRMTFLCNMIAGIVSYLILYTDNP
ncbi:MAG: hypothetical protein CMK59_13130 [Proteobacteria bacterium]|nr:hypothetical protein [Pseudomonadota bacterium]